MKKRRRLLIVIALAGVAAVALALVFRRGPRELVLTGIVTTDNVIVSSELQGRLQQLSAKQGDAVKRGQVLGLIAPREFQADTAYYESLEKSAAAQVEMAEADLNYQEALTGDQVKQAEAMLAANEAQAAQADADLENAKLDFEREDDLHKRGVNSIQDFDRARTAYASATARAEASHKQAQAARATVDLAKANVGVVAMRRAALEASRRQLAAAAAQKERAKTREGYTEIRAPVSGIVDVRAALEGEIVNPGQAILTLVDPDDLWIRADVEESYIDDVRIGDHMRVRFPSGAECEGTVFFRGVDADYATQRDVSRTKRDLKTFVVRLRCDNRDRRLAVGMTAYVMLPLDPPARAVAESHG
jgi:HlyD family secretion protein